jgi:uncharacterized membrane protein
MKKPVSLNLFIIVIGLTIVNFLCHLYAMPVILLLSFAGFFAGLFYTYKEQESKKYNRIGWIGNLLFFLTAVIGSFIYFLTHIS